MSRQVKEIRPLESPERKPSVFARLGSKEGSKTFSNSVKPQCAAWLENGTCPSGSGCKFVSSHVLISPSKRHKFETMKKQSGLKKSKDNNESWGSAESYDLGSDLEEADEKLLQKRRLELQRELKMHLKKDKKKKGRKEKKVKETKKHKPRSRSSSSSSSSSRSSSSSTPSAISKNKKRKRSPSSDESSSPRRKKRKVSKTQSTKMKSSIKKKQTPPRSKLNTKKKTPPPPPAKKSPSPVVERHIRSISKRKSPVKMSKSRPPSPKAKPKDSTPQKRIVKERVKASRSRSPRAIPPSRGMRSRTRSRSPVEKRRTTSQYASSPTTSSSRSTKSQQRPPSNNNLLDKGSSKTILPSRSTSSSHSKGSSRSRRTPPPPVREKDREKLRRRDDKPSTSTSSSARRSPPPATRDRSRSPRSSRDYQPPPPRDTKARDVQKRRDIIKHDLPSLLDIKTEAPPRRPRTPPPNSNNSNYHRDRGTRRNSRDRSDDDRRGNRKGSDYRGDSWNTKDSNYRDSQAASDYTSDRNKEYSSSRHDKWNDNNRDSNYKDRSWSGRFKGDRRSSTEDWTKDNRPKDDSKKPLESYKKREEKNADLTEQEEKPKPKRIALNKEDPTSELTEVLSDISDDVDDILNQQEPEDISMDDNAAPAAAVTPLPTTTNTNQNTESALPSTCISQQSADFFFDNRRPILDCIGEKNSDFEEISDEDLEEEQRMGKGIMDVLGADWASLMKQSKSVQEQQSEVSSTSVRSRWQIKSIINRLGISEKFASKDFVEEIMGEEVTLEHPVAAIQCALRDATQSLNFQKLLANRYRRGLSARLDLTIRRLACGLSVKETPLFPPIYDEKLYEKSIQLLESSTTS